MTLTDEELDKKIKYHNTCIDCKYSYVKDYDIFNFRYCKKFQYNDENNEDIVVDDDNYCDELEEE